MNLRMGTVSAKGKVSVRGNVSARGKVSVRGNVSARECRIRIGERAVRPRNKSGVTARGWNASAKSSAASKETVLATGAVPSRGAVQAGPGTEAGVTSKKKPPARFTSRGARIQRRPTLPDPRTRYHRRSGA